MAGQLLNHPKPSLSILSLCIGNVDAHAAHRFCARNAFRKELKTIDKFTYACLE